VVFEHVLLEVVFVVVIWTSLLRLLTDPAEYFEPLEALVGFDRLVCLGVRYRAVEPITAPQTTSANNKCQTAKTLERPGIHNPLVITRSRVLLHNVEVESALEIEDLEIFVK